MASSHLERSIESLAIERVLEFVHRTKRRGRLVYPLTEVADGTALDPETAERVLSVLESTGPYTVERLDDSYGEIRWRVTGSAYELDGWESDAWNV